MAVFKVNDCKHEGCGRTFRSLGELILHIEETHIDYNMDRFEGKKSSLTSVPFSNVVRFYGDSPVKTNAINSDVRKKLASIVKPLSVRGSISTTGSEHDDDEDAYHSNQSEESSESWTHTEEFSSDYILRYSIKNNPPTEILNGGGDKPFACPVPGCAKRYKNVNGIKYHSINGHKKNMSAKKEHKCECGKSYKSSGTLRAHRIKRHLSSSQVPPPGPGHGVKSPTLMKALQSVELLPTRCKPRKAFDDAVEKQLHISIPSHNNNKYETDFLHKANNNCNANAGYGFDNSVSPSSLGVLTPAPSPLSSASSSEKAVKPSINKEYANVEDGNRLNRLTAFAPVTPSNSPHQVE